MFHILYGVYATWPPFVLKDVEHANVEGLFGGLLLLGSPLHFSCVVIEALHRPIAETQRVVLVPCPNTGGSSSRTYIYINGSKCITHTTYRPTVYE